MRFYNSGKFTHQIGRHKETGELIEHIKDLAPKGHEIGTAIVNFPGSKFHRAVKAGDWVDVPDELTEDMVKNACPSLLNEEEAKPLIAALAKPAVKGKE